MEIIEACMQNDINKVVSLIEKGADVNTTDIHNSSLLHTACYHGYTELGITLVEKGASIDAINFIYDTPLLIACSSGYTELATFLIKKGADINVTNSSENTSLHEACYKNCPELVAFLLEKGAEINARNLFDYTPIYIAINNNCFEIIKTLLKKGAIIDDKIFRLVQRKENIQVMKILLENDHSYEYDQNNIIVVSALTQIKLEKISEKINILSELLKDIYETEPNDELDTLDIVGSMLKYPPVKTSRLN